MISLHLFTSPPSQCSYLDDRLWSLEYRFVAQATAAEYEQLLLEGWRRFGRAFFHPVCRTCQQCQSLRVPIGSFHPDRSQRRAWRDNADVQLQIGRPSVTLAKLDLYDRYHAFQSAAKDWPVHDPKDPEEYASSYMDNPFPTEEWCYYIDGRLVGVGYVDVLPTGLSAIYFFYDPDHRDRSLGTFNVLQVLASARERGIPYVYLGYYVAGCASLEYKARFCPNEVRSPSGDWVQFRSGRPRP